MVLQNLWESQGPMGSRGPAIWFSCSIQLQVSHYPSCVLEKVCNKLMHHNFQNKYSMDQADEV